MREMYNYLATLFGASSSDEGATAVEYGIMVALIAIVIIIAVTALGLGLEDVFDRVASEVSGLE